MTRRVVITGLGVVSPLGNSPEKLWESLTAGTSGVRELTTVPVEALPTRYGAEARDFTGSIENFGPLDKAMSRTIKKNLKVMCREMQMGIAVAQLALSTRGARPGRRRISTAIGIVYGSDYMLTRAAGVHDGHSQLLDRPRESSTFASGARRDCRPSSRSGCSSICRTCRRPHRDFQRSARPEQFADDARGVEQPGRRPRPYMTIVRGHADAMIAGATGTKVHPARTIARGDAGGDRHRRRRPDPPQPAVRPQSHRRGDGRRGRGDHARRAGLMPRLAGQRSSAK